MVENPSLTSVRSRLWKWLLMTVLGCELQNDELKSGNKASWQRVAGVAGDADG
jgi:hypothetical protein